MNKKIITSFDPDVAKKTSVLDAVVINALKQCFNEDDSKENGWFCCSNVFDMLPFLSKATVESVLISLFERNYIDLYKKYCVSSGEFDDWFCIFADYNDDQKVFGGAQ